MSGGGVTDVLFPRSQSSPFISLSPFGNPLPLLLFSAPDKAIFWSACLQKGRGETGKAQNGEGEKKICFLLFLISHLHSGGEKGEEQIRTTKGEQEVKKCTLKTPPVPMPSTIQPPLLTSRGQKQKKRKERNFYAGPGGEPRGKENIKNFSSSAVGARSVSCSRKRKGEESFSAALEEEKWAERDFRREEEKKK